MSYLGDEDFASSVSSVMTITITPAAVTVTADAQSKTYGDPDPTLTYQITSGSLVGNDTFSGELTRVAGEDVGSYAIEQGSLALSSNYTLTYVGRGSDDHPAGGHRHGRRPVQDLRRRWIR